MKRISSKPSWLNAWRSQRLPVVPALAWRAWPVAAAAGGGECQGPAAKEAAAARFHRQALHDDAVEPGLESGWRAEVVQRNADDELIRAEELVRERLGQLARFALRRGAVVVCDEVRAERRQIEVRDRVGGEIAVDHRPRGVRLLPGLREMGRECAAA